MSARLRWTDAEQAVATLEGHPSDGRLLPMLARFPLASAFLLEQLFDLRAGTAIYRSLARLRQAGLVGAIRPPLDPGCSPQRFYLTDLGLATLALDRQIDLHSMVRRLRLGGPDLLALLPSLPQLAALYELLGALIASGPVQPDFLAWQRPWHVRVQLPTAKTPVSLTLPAYAALSWNGHAGTFLLVPDLGELPLDVHRGALNHLFTLHRFHRLPTVLIAAPGATRAAGWRELLEDVRQRHLVPPLPAYVTPWVNLPTGDEQLLAQTGQIPASELRRSLSVAALQPRRSSSPLPHFVGDAFAPPERVGPTDGLGRVALLVSPTDRELLALVGRHPFLTLDRIATVLGWRRTAARCRRDRLVEMGLMRLGGDDEVGEHAARELVELTVRGMRLLAAQQGLSLGRAIACHGLTGGGPDEPVGARQALLANLAHTLGTDCLFVDLYRVASQLRAGGADDTVLEWQNGTACSRRHLRPDGYGRYYRNGSVYDFYVEYDRATMWAKGYIHKIQAYYAHWARQRFYHNVYSCPQVLVVTVTDAAEQRIVRVARSVAVGQYAPLPLLLTCQWRIDATDNPLGLLGPIWREAAADFDDRRCWLPN